MNHSGFECILVFAECCIGYKSMKSAAEVADSDSDYNVLIYNLHYSRQQTESGKQNWELGFSGLQRSQPETRGHSL